MKLRHLIPLLLLLVIFGCSDDESPLEPDRQFSGITERNEFGDTLSVDTTDWVITGIGVTSFSVSGLPEFRQGIPTGRIISDLNTDTDYSIGAFPNPFIPETGRLLIELIIPQEVNVEIRLEDESGDMVLPIWNGALQGIGIISYNGIDPNGQALSDGIYRIFFEAGLLNSFGDIEVHQSFQPEPAATLDYVIQADEYFSLEEYFDYEYDIATTFGADGILGGEVYTLPQITWENMTFEEKFNYLPVFMNYNIAAADGFQYHYLLAYKHFQFGAGWPDDGDVGIPDPQISYWQKSNAYHNSYLDMYEFGP